MQHRTFSIGSAKQAAQEGGLVRTIEASLARPLHLLNVSNLKDRFVQEKLHRVTSKYFFDVFVYVSHQTGFCPRDPVFGRGCTAS